MEACREDAGVKESEANAPHFDGGGCPFYEPSSGVCENLRPMNYDLL